MVSKTISDLSKVWGSISGVFLVLVALFPDEIRKAITSIFGVSAETLVFIAIIVLLLFGLVSSIVIVLVNRRHKDESSQEIVVMMPPLDQKSSSGLSRLRTSLTEKRTGFWTIIIIAGISGLILTALGLNLPFPIPMSANWVLYYAKMFIMGIGIALLLICTALMSVELYVGWESRKKHTITCLKLLTDFDDAFNMVQEVSAPELKVDMLHRLRSKLSPLCSSCSWKEAKERVGKVLEFMPEKLSSESPLYLQFLTMIIHSYGENVVEAVKKKWLKEIENLYDDTRSSFSLTDVLYILQELHGYDYSFMEKLVDDATLYWSKLRFDMLADHIGFAELKKRSPQAHKLMLKYLLRKLEDATKGQEDEIKKRIRFLYNKAVM
jgi:hypothetical protein